MAMYICIIMQSSKYWKFKTDSSFSLVTCAVNTCDGSTLRCHIKGLVKSALVQGDLRSIANHIVHGHREYGDVKDTTSYYESWIYCKHHDRKVINEVT